jgi:hypothetical protein
MHAITTGRAQIARLRPPPTAPRLSRGRPSLSYPPNGPSYAVKCLLHTPTRNSGRQRRLHMQEIALNQLESVHPNVVTLHRVIEEEDCTFIVMDYCPDGDLFGQTLKSDVILAETTSSNTFFSNSSMWSITATLWASTTVISSQRTLCFNGGLRLAITDFGLASTEKVSEEFRIGSLHHMSPGTSLVLSFLFILSRRTNACLVPQYFSGARQKRRC